MARLRSRVVGTIAYVAAGLVLPQPPVVVPVLTPTYLPAGFSTSPKNVYPAPSYRDRDWDTDLDVFGREGGSDPFSGGEFAVTIARREDGPPKLSQIGGRRKGRHLTIRGAPGILVGDRNEQNRIGWSLSWKPNRFVRIDIYTTTLTQREVLTIAREGSYAAGEFRVHRPPRGLTLIAKSHEDASLPDGHADTYEAGHDCAMPQLVVTTQAGGASDMLVRRWQSMGRLHPVDVRGHSGFASSWSIFWPENDHIIASVSLGYNVSERELLKVARSRGPKRPA